MLLLCHEKSFNVLGLPGIALSLAAKLLMVTVQ